MSGRSLLLNGLLIGIAPRADLQSAANPAQAFGGVRRTRRATHRTILQALELVQFDGALGFIQKLLVDHRFGDRQRFPLHILSLQYHGDVNLCCPVEPNHGRRIERCRTAGALLARLHLGAPTVSNDGSFHRVRANGTVHESVGLESGRGRRCLNMNLSVHGLPPFVN